MENIGGEWILDGLLFYWLFWAGWIMTTFFYPKTHSDRLTISAWLLGAITLSTITFSLFSIEWSGTGAFILLTIFVYGAGLPMKKLLYFMITSFIVMLANVSFLLFELFDPVWILIEREWTLVQVTIKSPSPASPEKVSGLAPIFVASLVISASPLVINAAFALSP